MSPTWNDARNCSTTHSENTRRFSFSNEPGTFRGVHFEIVKIERRNRINDQYTEVFSLNLFIETDGMLNEASALISTYHSFSPIFEIMINVGFSFSRLSYVTGFWLSI